ncbi:MAG: hypothetical protein K6E30_10940 [Lachnospiraceae bacterium]|nr:hypothetical protein [Lachnospiraceae bacterium]
MPQISKVRIANFQYNDGNRLIADELYDFENGENGPADVLINLANGGGKSVLVQLIMQPVIPKAKVGGRKIESFFTKARDHCYVLVEWSLDGSPMKLMTGIAMAASDSSDDSEEDRGFHIKYYTFLSAYPNYQGNYDIISLPLSRKENGRFIPASFDEVRNLARRSGGSLERYSSEDGAKWKDRLAQYGIIQNEWRMIEDLNANEDGLSKFFSSLKTSDALIDKLIIPRIEEKLRHGALKDDSSLETMLVSYAKQFSRQRETVRERDVCAGFSGMLVKAKEEAENLWKSSGSLEKGIGRLFGYADALEDRITGQKEREEELEEERVRRSEDIRHIRWEEASAEYYERKQELDLENEKLGAAESAKEEARKRSEEADKKFRLLECAHYYGQLKDIESRLKAIRQETASRENDTESADKLAALKYSACCAIKKEIGRMEPVRKGLSADKEDAKRAESALARELALLEKQVKSSAADEIRADEACKKQRQDNDEKVEALGISAIRMLDMKYPMRELDSWQQGLLEQERALGDQIKDTESRIREAEERRDQLPQIIADAKVKTRQLKADIDDLAGKLSDYHQAEEAVRAIYQKHGLDFARRFLSDGRDFLGQETAKAEAAEAECARKIEAAEEEIAAAGRGTLHIPKMLSDFLAGSGLRYTSAEKYLLTQREKGLLREEDCRKLLEAYPYAAYGVILEQKDLENLYQESDNKWLPSVLPLFTAEDIKQMLQGEAARFRTLSAYSKDYFRDRFSFEETLKANLESLHERKKQLRERKEALLSDAESLKVFASYEADWEGRILANKAGLEESVEKEEAHIAALCREQEELKGKMRGLREEEDKLKKALYGLQNRLRDYEKLLDKLKQEEGLQEKYSLARETHKKLAAEERKKAAEKEKISARLEEISTLLSGLDARRKALEKGYESVSDAPDAALLEGEWDALLREYEALLEAQNADLKRLRDEMDRLLKEKEDKEREIRKRDCRQEEYAGLYYTEELEKEAAERCRASKADYEAAEAERAKASRSQLNAEKSFEFVQERLQDFGGGPLPPDEVGNAFEARIQEAQKRLAGIAFAMGVLQKELSELNRIKGKTENAVETYTRPAEYSELALDEDYASQLKALTKEIREWKDRVDRGAEKVKGSLEKMAEAYGGSLTDVKRAIGSMRSLLLNESVRGDRYYTLLEHMEANIHTLELRIAQIDTDLKEFHKTREDLIRQCLIQGRQIYEGLLQLSSSSKVRVQGRRRQMIKFDIPEAVDEHAAYASITAEIDRGTEEIIALMADEAHSEAEVGKLAALTVGSRRLLRRYIGAENILLRAYKIDRTPENSGYRTWEQTQVNNSGAEKFVVYFAVILAVMAYARESFGDFGGKTERGVLVLDNPFGPISSRHVLEPMFEISRNYNVQMICLSDISKSDIVSCFDLVIRAIVKRFALSSKEQLTHEGNETIEHGFYRAEQLDLFSMK